MNDAIERALVGTVEQLKQAMADRAALAAAVVALEAAFCEPTYPRQIAAYKRFNRDHAPAIALAREIVK